MTDSEVRLLIVGALLFAAVCTVLLEILDGKK